MYGYRMSTSEEEQYHLWLMFASAMDHRAPMRVSYFKERSELVEDPVTGALRKQKIKGQYVKVTRVVEPHEFHVTKDGHRIVKVVDRTPEGVGSQPDYRTIRLDRVAYSRAQHKVLAERLMSQGYLCPSLLDNRPLHPTKGQLTGAAA